MRRNRQLHLSTWWLWGLNGPACRWASVRIPNFFRYYRSISKCFPHTLREDKNVVSNRWVWYIYHRFRRGVRVYKQSMPYSIFRRFSIRSIRCRRYCSSHRLGCSQQWYCLLWHRLWSLCKTGWRESLHGRNGWGDFVPGSTRRVRFWLWRVLFQKLFHSKAILRLRLSGLFFPIYRLSVSWHV